MTDTEFQTNVLKKLEAVKEMQISIADINATLKGLSMSVNRNDARLSAIETAPASTLFILHPPLWRGTAVRSVSDPRRVPAGYLG